MNNTEVSLAQEFVTYNRTMSTITISMALLAMFVGMYLCVRGTKDGKLHGFGESGPNINSLKIILGMIICAASMLALLMPESRSQGNNLSWCVKSWAAPQILVMDQITRFKEE